MLQSKLFEKIIEQHKNQAEALQQVSALLFLNKSNVYRRFTGESALKPNEIETLVKHYKISLDAMIHQGNNQILFTHSGSNPSKEEQNHITYYSQFKANYSLLLEKIPDFKSHYFGYDIPHYHHGELFPEILYFKSMQWKRLQWNPDIPFYIDLKQLDETGRNIIKEACHSYNRLNISEIWSTRGLDILLEQITYTFNLRQISYKDAQFLLHAIVDSVNALEEKARIGSKLLDKNQKNFNLYYSEVPLDYYLFVEYNEENPVLSKITTILDTPNFIITTNQDTIKKMYAMFQRIRNQSHKISETGELTRRKIFNSYRRKVRNAERKLNRP